MRPSSLSGRLFLGAVLWLAVALGIGGVVLTEAFRGSVERGFEQRLEGVLRAVAAGVEIAPDGSTSAVPRLAEPQFQKLYSGWYWQVSDQTGPIARSRSLWDTAFQSVDVGSGQVHVRDAVGPRGEPVLVVERDLVFPERAEPVHVIVAASRADIDGEVARFRYLLGLSLGGLGIGLLVAIVVQLRYGLRPLRALAADLEALRIGSGARLGGEYPDEVRPLVQATNKVLDHDAALIERARTHVGNLAHGLKTPLAILKAESSHRGSDAVIEEQVAAMTRLIEHHLGRARTVASSTAALGIRTPVAELVGELVAMMAKIFADKGVSLESTIEPGDAVMVDREDLAEMLGNLLDNACKYARRRVVVSARRQAGRLAIAVDDDGPGISEEQMAEAARRGARLDETIKGWGLGLSIVTDLVMLHGGRLHLSRSELGGLRAELDLPMAERHPTPRW